jgi:predicted RNase H-like HicB family nuclease
MLTDYIRGAMRQAHYELMENGHFFGSIPCCRGCWAEGETLEECRTELQSTLEDWLLLGLQLGHRLPVIEEINLNRRLPRKRSHAQASQA